MQCQGEKTSAISSDNPLWFIELGSVMSPFPKDLVNNFIVSLFTSGNNQVSSQSVQESVILQIHPGGQSVQNSEE